jgi:hypothetical protein
MDERRPGEARFLRATRAAYDTVAAAYAERSGHSVCLDYRRHHPDRIAELLQQAGFTLWARLVREPDGVDEKVARAYLLAQRGA